MVETYKPICFKCDEDGVIALATEERHGETLCSNCAESQDEAAYERQQDRYHSGIVTITELSERAHREREELRRRD